MLHSKLIQQADTQHKTNVGNDSYNSDGDFWVARAVTIHILIFGFQGQLQFTL